MTHSVHLSYAAGRVTLNKARAVAIGVTEVTHTFFDGRARSYLDHLPAQQQAHCKEGGSTCVKERWHAVTTNWTAFAAAARFLYDRLQQSMPFHTPC